jgi:hypothetical protein
MDIDNTPCTEEQKENILNFDFTSIVCLFISASISSAEHAYIGFFPLLIRTYED